MKVWLSRGLQEQVFRHLEASYPHEGGGFLFGSLDGQQAQIVEATSVENIFESEERYHRILLSPQEYARLEDEADARGLTLVGYYHSHPDSAAVPSVYDRDHAWPNFVYLITQVQVGKAVDMLAWRLREDRSQFDAASLTVGE